MSSPRASSKTPGAGTCASPLFEWFINPLLDPRNPSNELITYPLPMSADGASLPSPQQIDEERCSDQRCDRSDRQFSRGDDGPSDRVSDDYEESPHERGRRYRRPVVTAN